MIRTIAFVALLATPALAQPAGFPDAVDQLDRLSIRARRAGGACRDLVSPRVVDLADRLDAQRAGRPRGLGKSLDELSDLATLASSQRCPDDVTDGLIAAMNTLADVRAALWADRRPDEENAIASLSPLQLVDTPDGKLQVSVPDLTLRGIRGQAFALSLKVRSTSGLWTELERTQRWSVPSDPFVWTNAWTFTIARSRLAPLDKAGGRFVARVAVVDDRQRELGGREARFGPPVGQAPQRDCGTGADLACALPRGGVLPMERAPFEAALAAIGAEKNEGKRVSAAVRAVGGAMLTAAQLGLVLDRFVDERLRLDAADALLSRVVNPSDAAASATRFKSVDLRTRFLGLIQRELNPSAPPRAFRVSGQMDRRAFAFEAATRDDVRARCREWKEGDVATQGFIMRLTIDGRGERTDVLNTDKACSAVAEAAAPIY